MILRSISFLLLSLIPLSALSQQSSPPLSENEKRLILRQLYELEAARAQILTYEDFIARDKTADQRERENADRAIELERQATALAEKERDLAKEQAALYKSLLEATRKKGGGIGCVFKKIFTLGLSRCGG